MVELLKALINAKPEVRYFTMVCYNQGQLGLAQENVANTAKRVGVSKDVVSASFHYMSDNGFFEKQSLPNPRLVGRSISRYVPTVKLHAILSRIALPKIHWELINELLVGRVPGSTHSNLKLSNRLLLCVFLLHADQFGLVEHLGFATISKLTGMSRDQFNSQLEKLIQLGYIAQIATGVTSKHIFGSAASIYRVNVSREQFKQAIFHSLTCEDAFWNEDLFTRLIQLSKAGLQEYLASQSSNSIARKNHRGILEYQIATFTKLVGVENAEHSWKVFYEIDRPVMRRFMFEKLLLIAGVQLVTLRRAINDDLSSRLVDELRHELKPRFKKANSIEPKVTNDVSIAKQVIDEEENTFSNLFVTGDLAVFSKVLINSVMLPFMRTLSHRLSILEEHFGVTFVSCYLMLNGPTNNPFSSLRSLVLLYPASLEAIANRVRLENESVKDLSKIEENIHAAMMHDLSID